MTEQAHLPQAENVDGAAGQSAIFISQAPYEDNFFALWLESESAL